MHRLKEAVKPGDSRSTTPVSTHTRLPSPSTHVHGTTTTPLHTGERGWPGRPGNNCGARQHLRSMASSAHELRAHPSMTSNQSANHPWQQKLRKKAGQDQWRGSLPYSLSTHANHQWAGAFTVGLHADTCVSEFLARVAARMEPSARAGCWEVQLLRPWKVWAGQGGGWLSRTLRT